MSDSNAIGKIGWIDMTVEDAPAVRDFYEAVVGWTSTDVSMGDYSDYSMIMPETEDCVAGICHARGSNAELPAGWLIYITVADVDASAMACREHGGKLLVEPRGLAGGRFCVIEDPGGSVATVRVTVTCVDDPPTAVDDMATVTEDDPATPIPVLTNDTDTDGGPISVASVTQPCLLYTSPSPRDGLLSRMPSSA